MLEDDEIGFDDDPAAYDLFDEAVRDMQDDSEITFYELLFEDREDDDDL